MNQEELFQRLKAPFTFNEIEWKIQVTTQDKARGMAVAYMDARAVQKRLDDTVGPFNWKNVYSLWHDNAQICGISIFNSERNEWVTKYDGAENSDFEPIKGGLSDSFKRSATAWGIGRYLYELAGIWVEIEPKGKSYAIKQNQYGKLESEYNTVINQLLGSKPDPQGASVSSPARQTQSASMPQNVNNDLTHDYRVHSVKPSGQSSQVLELIGSNGNKITAYVKASDKSIVAGSNLRKVRLERKTSTHGDYNLITGYEAA